MVSELEVVFFDVRDPTDVGVASIQFMLGWTPVWWAENREDHDPGDEDRS